MPNGVRDGHGIPFDSISRIGTLFLRTRNNPSIIMSYAEVLFLQAEAALRGWIAGDPAALYAQGITESMLYYGIAQTAINTYLAQPAVAYDPARAMQQIQLQKWIALFSNSGRWSDSNRLRTRAAALCCSKSQKRATGCELLLNQTKP